MNDLPEHETLNIVLPLRRSGSSPAPKFIRRIVLAGGMVLDTRADRIRCMFLQDADAANHWPALRGSGPLVMAYAPAHMGQYLLPDCLFPNLRLPFLATQSIMFSIAPTPARWWRDMAGVLRTARHAELLPALGLITDSADDRWRHRLPVAA